MDLPPVAGPDDWVAVHAQPVAPWQTALKALGVELGRPGPWERLPGGEDSVVFAQADVVLKLVPPFLARDAQREVSVLRRLELHVPVPRVLDVRLHEGWTAVLLTRLSGVMAERVWPEVPQPERLRILWALGDALRALGLTPLHEEDGDASALLMDLEARAWRHQADGFDDVASFLRHNLPDPLPPPAMVHMDLNHGNVLLERREGRWQLSGVLDFVASRAAHPALDLVTPGVFFCRGEPALLHALLDGAGALDRAPEELAAWHLLHPFGKLSRDLALAGRPAGPATPALVQGLWATR
jgi:hygromycin-B 7''-O-kinase